MDFTKLKDTIYYESHPWILRDIYIETIDKDERLEIFQLCLDKNIKIDLSIWEKHYTMREFTLP